MIVQLILYVTAALLIHTVYNLIHNLFLHPLARVPGPKLAAASVWYERYFDLWLPGRYPFELKRLHAKYGPIIRPTPSNEVHINDPDFLETIYALRGRNHHVGNGLFIEQSVAGAEEYALHKLRRDALNPYFSQKAVMTMEDLMTKKLKQMMGMVEHKVGEILNLSDLFFAFSNDLVRSTCFGSDNGLLANLEESSRQRISLMTLLTGIKINNHFPWIATVLDKLLGEKGTPPAIKDLLQFKANAKKDIEAVFADTSDDKRGTHSVFYELRDSPILPPHEKTIDRLQDEATILVMAGTESTAKSSQYGIYYLLANPAKLARLRSELDSAQQKSRGTPLTLSTLLTLPYLSATIQEVNRLSFGVTSRMLSYSPTETLTYTSTSGPFAGTTYTLPPGTRMSCTSWCAHTHPTLFPDPLAFEPERWLGDDEIVRKRKRAMIALGKGDRRCLGMHIAQAALAMTFAEFAGNWDMRLAEGTTYADVEFSHDYQIAHPRLDTKGIRVEIVGRRKWRGGEETS